MRTTLWTAIATATMATVSLTTALPAVAAPRTDGPVFGTPLPPTE